LFSFLDLDISFDCTLRANDPLALVAGEDAGFEAARVDAFPAGRVFDPVTARASLLSLAAPRRPGECALALRFAAEALNEALL
jgi:hypothetical protein